MQTCWTQRAFPLLPSPQCACWLTWPCCSVQGATPRYFWVVKATWVNWSHKKKCLNILCLCNATVWDICTYLFICVCVFSIFLPLSSHKSLTLLHSWALTCERTWNISFGPWEREQMTQSVLFTFLSAASWDLISNKDVRILSCSHGHLPLMVLYSIKKIS